MGLATRWFHHPKLYGGVFMVFRLSLDRIDDDKPYFLQGRSLIETFRNLSFVPQGLNNTAPIVAKFWESTYQEMQKQVENSD